MFLDLVFFLIHFNLNQHQIYYLLIFFLNLKYPINNRFWLKIMGHKYGSYSVKTPLEEVLNKTLNLI
jgi:hypothetical protein